MYRSSTQICRSIHQGYKTTSKESIPKREEIYRFPHLISQYTTSTNSTNITNDTNSTNDTTNDTIADSTNDTNADTNDTDTKDTNNDPININDTNDTDTNTNNVDINNNDGTTTSNDTEVGDVDVEEYFRDEECFEPTFGSKQDKAIMKTPPNLNDLKIYQNRPLVVAYKTFVRREYKSNQSKRLEYANAIKKNTKKRRLLPKAENTYNKEMTDYIQDSLIRSHIRKQKLNTNNIIDVITKLTQILERTKLNAGFSLRRIWTYFYSSTCKHYKREESDNTYENLLNYNGCGKCERCWTRLAQAVIACVFFQNSTDAVCLPHWYFVFNHAK